MDRLFSAVTKEFLYLVRDIPGLIILFIMPLLLVLVVTLAQDTATGGGKRTEVIVVDQAGTPLSAAIINDLDSSAMFRVTATRDNQTVSKPGTGIILTLHALDTAITLQLDPSINGAYRSSLMSTLSFIIKGAEAKRAMEGTLSLFFRSSDTVMKSLVRSQLIASMKSMPPLRLQENNNGKAEIRPSIIQNNVPGFILFAMFFIVIPLSASMIVEKNEGAFMRLKVLPVTWLTLLSAKVLVYVMVCLIQFLLMMVMGTWGFHALFGMEPLAIGHNWSAIFVVTLAASLAAVGFGILAGAVAKTVAQAALAGSVLVVLLGLISGTFLPVYLLPGWIRAISMVSPIRWGIDGYLHIIVLGQGIKSVMTDILLLVMFFSLAMTISIFIFARRK
jgi:ABC-2 type transport system permease protein